jgi:hypothetical protein
MHLGNSMQNIIMQNTGGMSIEARQTQMLQCNEEMPVLSPHVPDHNEPSNLKRRRVLPPMFLAPTTASLPENASDADEEENGGLNAFRSDRDVLARMQLAVQLLFADIEDREAENRRETADYLQGDTPRTSQESNLSEYNWSARDSGQMIPLDEIMQFIWKYLPRQRIYERVRPFLSVLSVSEEMYQRDSGRVKELVAEVLDCEPVRLLNTLEDAIELAEQALGIVFDAEELQDSDGEA